MYCQLIASCTASLLRHVLPAYRSMYCQFIAACTASSLQHVLPAQYVKKNFSTLYRSLLFYVPVFRTENWQGMLTLLVVKHLPMCQLSTELECRTSVRDTSSNHALFSPIYSYSIDLFYSPVFVFIFIFYYYIFLLFIFPFRAIFYSLFLHFL
jgi:hypothetical protein